MQIKKILISLAMLAFSTVTMAQDKPPEVPMIKLQADVYVKPCLIQVMPGMWMNLNRVFYVYATPDGMHLELVMQDGKAYSLPAPADQARNYAQRAVSNLEACRR